MPIKNIGQVTSVSVQKNTGKSWDQWIAILEKAGGKSMDHKDLVEFLRVKHKLTPWWQQMVASGFEKHIGRRVEGQNLKGLYTMTATRTLSVKRDVLWRFIVSPEGQKIWLKPLSPMPFRLKAAYEVEGGIFGELRTFKVPERFRMTWQDSDWDKPAILQVWLVSRPGNKTILVFNFDSIKNTKIKEDLRVMWKKRLDEVAQHFGEVD